MQLIASGRDADVFALDEQRVLRRSRVAGTHSEHEAAMMEWARNHGYPVPRVHSVDGPDMVLERIHGPTLADSIVAGTTTMTACGRMLADLHAQLHALPPPEGDDPSLTLVHLDLHPLNVLLCKSGPVVIDWSNSRAGRGGVDVALTAVILAQTASVDGPYVQPAAVLLDAFLEQAGPIAADDVDAAIRYRSHNPTLSSLELAVLPQVPSRLLR